MKRYAEVEWEEVETNEGPNGELKSTIRRPKCPDEHWNHEWFHIVSTIENSDPDTVISIVTGAPPRIEEFLNEPYVTELTEQEALQESGATVAEFFDAPDGEVDEMLVELGRDPIDVRSQVSTNTTGKQMLQDQEYNAIRRVARDKNLPESTNLPDNRPDDAGPPSGPIDNSGVTDKVNGLLRGEVDAHDDWLSYLRGNKNQLPGKGNSP